MGNYEYILFDLDGTLTDSGPGIVNGFAYTVEKMGGQVEDKNQFKRFVGPPLKESFGVLGYQGEEIDKAITIYREYYNGMGGCFENEVYPGIEDTLAKLKTAGKKLIVCTSKNAHGTKTVLEHFGLDKYFDFVATANDTDRQHKIDVLNYALEQGGVADLKRAVMVGDRMYDIEASAEVGVDSIGVLYGYGSKKELTNAGATYLAETADDIVALIL
ncbi:HAD-IA family hydrolase [Butyrivibrio sp. VCD2006]|uniref:HAD-IA family hydrolase n=1 Tax=Butyrivibrio sp. VCD2006 TaxID=1280664 RepID=UPI00041FA982|nr:HAD-IA family hydrolase [Butyrivibrio sp. VCD2006]